MKPKNKKKKVNEGALDGQISSYPTSSTTSQSNKPGVNVNIKKKDLSDPSLQQNLSKLKNPSVTVVDESNELKPNRLKYLSEVKDSKTGNISKPFTIKNKNYQMVRAIGEDKKPIMGVYSLDERNENGENIIYGIDEFEKMIGGREGMSVKNEDVIDEPADEVNPNSKADEMGGPSFAGYKHYIVNRKSGKARKFKNVEELAKANMTEEEEYMGIKGFKKYVDEVLFGGNKKQVKEIDAQGNNTQVTDTQTQVTNTQTSAGQGTSPIEQKMQASAEKLMELIKTKIPNDVVHQITTNHIAQREVILAFAEMVGVPNTEINKIILGIKGMGKNTTGAVSENVVRLIKVKDLK